ncbi:hypothetical protein CBM2615_A10043 [Cupriavidus taiwanensis]|uniref:Uncharacterized protein n=1 Tax=Cupriavidus taiwanensis TaxID=164546 RepID=A0A375DV46_9BURK|nr:hypothetical protein CBM2614_A10043 [Cupriavidus taiwanensis]SOZ48780.1 hypothetical protein CBM2615_A10043 [Cupriavidus taiwanensis]SOZ51603.1 hypothetical protein CBM2613_A10043 [Cupriavidus taiwanensis]SPA03984.1 hypothetical protein CBM2625_A10043 [Cupriavidus taiwanensis]
MASLGFIFCAIELRSNQNSEHLRVNSQEPEIEEGMHVCTQKKAVRRMICARALVRNDMRSLERLYHGAT